MYPAESQGGWDDDGSEPQGYAEHRWDDAQIAGGQESWNDEGGYSASSYNEPSWQDNDTRVEQSGLRDDGEYQVGVVGQEADPVRQDLY